jgi:hypothetical protein
VVQISQCGVTKVPGTGDLVNESPKGSNSNGDGIVYHICISPKGAVDE